MMTDDEQIEFRDSLNAVMGECCQIAFSKGWFKEGEKRNDGELIALQHSELSEALEGLRHGNPPSDKIPKFSSAEEEFADVVIRIFDHCTHRNWDLAGAILAKMEFNRGREIRHGNKEF